MKTSSRRYRINKYKISHKRGDGKVFRRTVRRRLRSRLRAKTRRRMDLV